MAVGSLAAEQLEQCLRADDAVVVLELVGKLQRPARLAFGLLGDRPESRLYKELIKEGLWPRLSFAGNVFKSS